MERGTESGKSTRRNSNEDSGWDGGEDSKSVSDVKKGRLRYQMSMKLEDTNPPC